jgi:hypothetical protein
MCARKIDMSDEHVTIKLLRERYPGKYTMICDAVVGNMIILGVGVKVLPHDEWPEFIMPSGVTLDTNEEAKLQTALLWSYWGLEGSPS